MRRTSAKQHTGDKMTALQGVMPILPTIFSASGAIDEPGTRRVLEYVIEAGAAAVGLPRRCLPRPGQRVRHADKGRAAAPHRAAWRVEWRSPALRGRRERRHDRG